MALGIERPMVTVSKMTWYELRLLACAKTFCLVRQVAGVKGMAWRKKEIRICRTDLKPFSSP